MNSLSKNACIDKLDDIVQEYNNSLGIQQCILYNN